MTTTAAPARTNILAIATFVLGLLGFNVVAVISGHIALSQIKRRGETGTALAVIGLVLGYLEIVGIILLVVLWVMVANSGQLVVE